MAMKDQTDHDLVKPRLLVLDGISLDDEDIRRALAIGCPDGYCGRFNSCGICWLANRLSVFEPMRDAKPEGYED